MEVAMQRLCLALGAALLLACSRGEEPPKPPVAEPETAFGTVTQVGAYRSQIEPFILAVTDAQHRVEAQIGSSGRATPANLAAAMGAVRPELQAAYDDFRQLTPPAGLAGLHDKMGHLMACRLEAYASTLEGWKTERATGDTTSGWREHTQAKLAEANALIGELNTELQAVDAALRAASPTQVASP
jgi:hypothetical protein